jgi:tetratricopeptide (TPR) repeat protein
MQQAISNRWEEMLILNELGILYTTVGQYDRAFEHLGQAMEHSRVIESEIGSAYILCNLGQAQRDAGRLAEALDTLEQGLLLAEAQGDVHLQAIYRSDIAFANLRAGQNVAAVEQAQRSLALFFQLDQPLSQTAVYATLAAAQLALGNHSAAELSARAALAILDDCGGEGPDFPQRDYWLCAQTLAALGRTKAARHAEEQALALLLQRAERISNPSLRHSYLTHVAVHPDITAATAA